MRILCLQHLPIDDSHSLAAWTGRRGFTLTCVRPADMPLPSCDGFDLIVVLGGLMSAYDESAHPWLRDEKRWLAEAVHEGRRVLGLCLGGQLLAAALGAEVFRMPAKEIGWLPVHAIGSEMPTSLLRDLPETFDAFQWHGDAFDLPRGAVRLARSALCENQAFQFGPRAIGTQFHVEYTAENVRQLASHCPEDLALLKESSEHGRDPLEQLAAGDRAADARRLFHQMLDAIMRM